MKLDFKNPLFSSQSLYLVLPVTEVGTHCRLTLIY